MKWRHFHLLNCLFLTYCFWTKNNPKWTLSIYSKTKGTIKWKTALLPYYVIAMNKNLRQKDGKKKF